MLSCTPGGRKWIFNSLYKYMLFPARRFSGISGSGFMRLWGEWMEWWLREGSETAFRVKNSEILGGFT